MKKHTIAAAVIAAALLLTGVSACSEPAAEQENTETQSKETENAEMENTASEDSYATTWTHLRGIYLVTDVYGDGQKPWYVVLEYDRDLAPESVSADDYEVEGYEIEAIYTNTKPELPEKSEEGSYVLLELSTDYTTQNYGGSGAGGQDDISGPMEGGGRGMMFGDAGSSNQLSVTVRQTGEITFADGTTVSAWSDSYPTEPEDNVNLLVENFSLDTFPLSNGSEMMYALYLPEGYDENEAYPLVLFMPDATGEGDDAYLALTESLGGVIWTTEEWQSEHETIVLVPQYVSNNTEDPALTMELLEYIADAYGVDRTREYLVGQSSGTIRSIKLMIDYPDEFAAGLLVAGQTDSAYTDRMADLASQHIWMICSEGDARAYPGMTEITEAVEAAGTPVSIAQWSAQLPLEEQEELAAEQADAGTAINWTILDKGTVMRDDVSSSDATEHMNTWRVAYDLTTVREWLFEQKK